MRSIGSVNEKPVGASSLRAPRGGDGTVQDELILVAKLRPSSDEGARGACLAV